MHMPALDHIGLCRDLAGAAKPNLRFAGMSSASAHAGPVVTNIGTAPRGLGRLMFGIC
jgi:hypothetical protein